MEITTCEILQDIAIRCLPGFQLVVLNLPILNDIYLSRMRFDEKVT